jgi:hypothetical protein
LPAEDDRAVGVAAQLGQVRAVERDRRGDVGQQARGPAHRGLIELIVHAAGACQPALGGVQQALDRLQAATEQGQQRLRQQQPRPGADQLLRQYRQPALQSRPLAAHQQAVGVPLDQPRRPIGVPGGRRVVHRVVGQPVRLCPGGRGPVQPGHPLGPLALQAGAQQVGEQLVVAPPAAHRIQRHQEQVGPLDRLQHCLALVAAGDRVAQLPRQPLQH